MPYYSEILPARYIWVGPLLASHLSGFVIGGALPILFAWFFLSNQNKSWELYVAICSVPLVLLIIVAIPLFDDSAAFLASQGKQEKAEKLIRKYANSRNAYLPTNFTIKQKNYDNNALLPKEDNHSFTDNLIYSLKNGRMMRLFICTVMIGTATLTTSFGSNFIVTNLLFLLGQTGSYCQGTQSNTYYLVQDDYSKLLIFQLTGIFPVIVLVPVLKALDGKFREVFPSIFL